MSNQTSNQDDLAKQGEEEESSAGGNLVPQDSKRPPSHGEEKTVRPSTDSDTEKTIKELVSILGNASGGVRRTFQMMGTRISGGPVAHPLLEKFNEEHINKMLDYAQRDEDNAHKLRASNRWFGLGYATLGLGVFVFLVIFLLPDNKEILVELLKLIVAFAGGVGSGFGLKIFLDRRR